MLCQDQILIKQNSVTGRIQSKPRPNPSGKQQLKPSNVAPTRARTPNSKRVGGRFAWLGCLGIFSKKARQLPMLQVGGFRFYMEPCNLKDHSQCPRHAGQEAIGNFGRPHTTWRGAPDALRWPLQEGAISRWPLDQEKDGPSLRT